MDERDKMNEAAGSPREQQFPEGDVIRILLDQHQLIRALFAEVGSARNEEKQKAFDLLRSLLAVHEVAEEMIVRPVTSGEARDVADARNHEEAEATTVLAELERMDIESAEWQVKFEFLQRAVEQHADHEEAEEFPLVAAKCGPDQRKAMGARLELVERMAPTHAHPSTAGSPIANWLVGPFVGMLDRARDALGGTKG